MVVDTSWVSDFSTLAVRVDEHGICYVYMDRPQTRNAISRIMTHELDRAFARACDDARVKVIVVGSTSEHFSSGHDLGSAEHLSDLQSNSFADMGYPGPSGEYKKWSD